MQNSDCDLENPPDECLRRVSGLVETGNPTFNVLVLWQLQILDWTGILRNPLQRLVHRDLPQILNSCQRETGARVTTLQTHVDGFFNCVRTSIGWSRRPVLAVLPTARLGRDCEGGGVVLYDLHGGGFRVTVVIMI